MNRLLMLLLIAGLVAGSMAEFNFSRELGKKDDGDYSGKKEKNNDYDDKKKKQNAKKYDDDYGKKGQKEKGDVMVANNNYDEKKQNAKKYDDDYGKKGKKEKGGVMVAKIDTDNNKGGGGISTFPVSSTTDTPTNARPSSMPTLSPVNNIPTVTPLRPDFVVTAEFFDLVVASSTDNGAAVRTVGSPQQQAYVWLESDVQAARNRRLRQQEQEQEHRYPGHTSPSLATRDLLADLHPFRYLQRYSLMTLFYATNGPTEWNNKASLGDTDESECLWDFNNILVDCETQTFDWEETNPDGTTNVTSIQEKVLIKLEVENNRVTGNLVAEVAQLTSLRILVIDNTANSDAGLTGGIPAEWSALTNLEQVKIVANQFTEPLPPDLTRNWDRLQRLNLARNQLPGPLPTSLTESNHPQLQQIIVTDNQLTGVLTGIATITTLTQLVLNDNLFEGELPPELGNLQSLRSLKLGGNRFSGNFPSFVSTLTELKADCDLSRNQFSGVIPNDAFAD